MKYEELIGSRFGKLLVIGVSGGKMIHLKCKCDCGNESVPQVYSVLRGISKSCGCGQIEKATKHGHFVNGQGTKTYEAWSAMKARCDNPKNKFYARYGGRGIAYCEAWKVFENFLADMGDAPEGLTLDRKDNDGGYSPKNCRWATWRQQHNNKRNVVRWTLNGITKTRQEWCEEYEINSCTVTNRLKRGWDMEKALTFPVDEAKSKGALSRKKS